MGLPRAAFNYHNMRGVCGKKGLSRATFNYHIMVETEEGKGLPRATFNYHLFCRNVGRKRGCLEPHLITI
jgi:hypothetical protein